MTNETRTGIQENAGRFIMLIIINLFVGAMVGLERTVLPLVGEMEFGLASASASLSFIISFGFSKAMMNLVAGTLADRFGRKVILIAGWSVGFLVPLFVITATEWWMIVAANVLLGINQALTWSMTVNMKIDMVKTTQRGLAIGLNEAAGYIGLSLAAMLSGYIAAMYGLRPEPFYVGFLFAGVGLLLSFFAGNTSGDSNKGSEREGESFSITHVFVRTTCSDRHLSSACFAGWATNFKDGMAWGLFPVFFISVGLTIDRLALIVAAYPVAWGVCQLFTGGWSDRVGRKPLIVGGMVIQAAALWIILGANQYVIWLGAAVLLGFGTALVYPTLQAAVTDASNPIWRASSLGVYRFWRDSGYAFGALSAGVITDWINVNWAIGIVAAIPMLAGINAFFRLKTERV